MPQWKNISVLFFCILAFIVIIHSNEYSRLLRTIPLETYEYPTTLNPDIVSPIISAVSTEQIEKDLLQLINDLPSDRYYKSENGYNSALYIKKYLEDLTTDFKDSQHFEIKLFEHKWKQPSVLFKMKGRSSKTIIIGCHIDSINFKSFNNAPGVDDNLSGIVTVFQTIKHLIESRKNGLMELENSVEFHFYAAEEVGSIGSTEIMQNYYSENIEIVALLQQDMTGYIRKSIESGQVEHFGIITDYISTSLMKFTKLIIENYCLIPYLETQCGKICSDHISGLIYGYPSVYVLESKVELSNPFIHSINDTIDKISFDHMKEHIKLTIAFTMELAISKNIIKQENSYDYVSFRYIDFLVLLMMHHTKTFVYAVIFFAAFVGTIYTIILDMRSSSVKKTDDQKGKYDKDSEFGELLANKKISKGKKIKKQL